MFIKVIVTLANIKINLTNFKSLCTLEIWLTTWNTSVIIMAIFKYVILLLFSLEIYNTK